MSLQYEAVARLIRDFQAKMGPPLRRMRAAVELAAREDTDESVESAQRAIEELIDAAPAAAMEVRALADCLDDIWEEALVGDDSLLSVLQSTKGIDVDRALELLNSIARDVKHLAHDVEEAAREYA